MQKAASTGRLDQRVFSDSSFAADRFSGKRKAERKCGVEHVQLYDRRLSAWRDPSCKEKKRGGKAWKALT